MRRVDKGLYRNAVTYDGENITGYIGGDYLSDPRPGYLKEAAGIVDYVYLEAPLTSAGVVRYPTATAHYRNLGYREYELTNHLGNVLATILDRRTGYKSSPSAYYYNYYTADVTNAQDYYPFGMMMPGRTFVADTSSRYRYGFNGMERDDEIKGKGNSYDFGARMYDPRVGRWLSVDPLAGKYPGLSSYNFVSNSPLMAIDPDGKKIVIVGNKEYQEKVMTTLMKMASESDIFRSMLDQAISSNNVLVISDNPHFNPEIGSKTPMDNGNVQKCI